ncbi:hypothetical protein Kpol_1013p75 [Vanderwaltozyma polyspora DSM 70294]|uniref:Peptidase M20 dimerisation domain-containing protein n=1 Tax=Vanderwaltozyma polyspora (strain ATCC 22028 / DSM 70294 / BCRC 21397 / CBS 2163 / NBRC 10782 / NRRL Y-8283 / UCD 57-17) TaxID=436907 RepID=A7THB9_VANPO|nr:uncharacterized protein Kpol_1013p75 [Vanderwaltozyma polyspora DSM 70294]EDO18400.1 hypothetical protein Kpol_1013p75 [Vanderwaltozyma polyspora DSM 70294]
MFNIKYLTPIGLLVGFIYALYAFQSQTSPNAALPPFKCQVYDKVHGTNPSSMQLMFKNKEFRDDSIKKLANAIRIPTEMFDKMPNPEDDPSFEGWLPFRKLHEQLRNDFPLVWSSLNVETVNHYGLLLTWKGYNETLKPAIFAAHQDVVPVEKKTWNEWKHEPFSGHFDGDYIWGRGSFDDKSMLIGILQTIEYILKNEPEFVPSRSIILASGFDEEASGNYGAKYLNEVLLERYGHDGIYSIVDEGMSGISEIAGVMMASPSTGEKGFLNLEFRIDTRGGHSSVPPDHTSIGIAADLIKLIEDQKFEPLFTKRNPITDYFQCAAEFSTKMDSNLKWDFLHAIEDRAANQRVLDFIINKVGRLAEYFFRTSQSVDMIKGGVKSNALPESVSFVVNSRIAVESSVEETIQKFIKQAEEIANKYDLTLTRDGKDILTSGKSGKITLSTLSTLEPAPVSPANDVWREFAGTIKGYFEDVIFPLTAYSGRELIVAPSIMTGNTDTSHYWNLTKNIYRFHPSFANMDVLLTIHSVNEHIDPDSVMHVIGFFYDYIHVIA